LAKIQDEKLRTFFPASLFCVSISCSYFSNPFSLLDENFRQCLGNLHWNPFSLLDEISRQCLGTTYTGSLNTKENL
jgi:hypothetical protein